MHKDVLPRLVDAVVVFVDDVEMNDLENVRGRVRGFGEVAADDLDLDAAVRGSDIVQIDINTPGFQRISDRSLHSRSPSAQVGRSRIPRRSVVSVPPAGHCSRSVVVGPFRAVLVSCYLGTFAARLVVLGPYQTYPSPPLPPRPPSPGIP